MTKEPFTQELLLEVYERHGLVTVELLQDVLPSWTDKDIMNRLNQWRFRKVIDYKKVNGDIEDFCYLKHSQQQTEEITEGRRLKMDIYYRQVRNALEIMESPTANYNQRLKAMERQAEALKEIPDDTYKELEEIYS